MISHCNQITGKTLLGQLQKGNSFSETTKNYLKSLCMRLVKCKFDKFQSMLAKARRFKGIIEVFLHHLYPLYVSFMLYVFSVAYFSGSGFFKIIY